MAQGKLDSHRQNTDTTFVYHDVQKVNTKWTKYTKNWSCENTSRKYRGGGTSIIITENDFLIGQQKYQKN